MVFAEVALTVLFIADKFVLAAVIVEFITLFPTAALVIAVTVLFLRFISSVIKLINATPSTEEILSAIAPSSV